MFEKSKKQSYPQCFKESSKPHKFCPGCGHGMALKELGFAFDELKIANKTFLGIDIGCSLLAWDFFDVNTIQTHHGRTVPVVSGFKNVNNDAICIAYVGDGGAYAIGLQSLLHSAMRNDAITVLVINNTLYGMTGGQMAPTTMTDEITTTTPKGKETNNIVIKGPELIKSINKKAFVARAVVTKPLELRKIIKYAIEHQVKNKSFSFVEVLSMCPVNWKMDARESLDMLEDKMEVFFKPGEVK